MITERTALVLGAGASDFLGFPLGRRLKHEVTACLIGRYQELDQLGYSHDQRIAFAQALQDSGQDSVDAFMERHVKSLPSEEAERFMRIGKLAIARALIPNEDVRKFSDSGVDAKNWYRYLFHVMDDTGNFDRFGDNALAVVTFNYDRSFEHFLFTSLKNSYNKSDAECAEQVKEIPVVHVHGRLGYLPWEKKQPMRPYTDNHDMEACCIAAESTKVMHEADAGKDQDFKAARVVLAWARRIFFLGFGYNGENVERLGLRRTSHAGTPMLGTTYEYTRREEMDLRGRMPEQFQGKPVTVMNAVRTYCVWD